MGLADALLLCPERDFHLFLASVSFVYLSFLPEFRATTNVFGYSSSSLLLCSLSLGFLLVTFQMSFFFFSVLSALFVFLFPGLLLFLLVVALCLSLLVLPRVRCPIMLFASFSGPSSLVLTTPSLLPLPLIGLFLLPLLSCLLLFAQYSWACCFLGLFS